MTDLLFTTYQAAERMGLARATLAKLRVIGGGPPFRKLGARVLYAERDLAAWLDSRPLFASTAQFSDRKLPRLGPVVSESHTRHSPHADDIK